MHEKVEKALNELRKYRARHFELGRYVHESGPMYPLDLLATAALNRSLNLMKGFCALIEARNFLAAAPLIRLQLDSCLRFSAAWLVDDPHDFADKVLYDKRVDRLQDRDGNQLRDRYLVDKLAKEYPWVKDVYKQTSGYIHLSNKHIINAHRPRVEEGTLEGKIAEGDSFVTDELYLEAIAAFKAITDILFEYVYRWGYTKRHPPLKSSSV
jgi:hypothetical protein